MVDDPVVYYYCRFGLTAFAILVYGFHHNTCSAFYNILEHYQEYMARIVITIKDINGDNINGIRHCRY